MTTSKTNLYWLINITLYLQESKALAARLEAERNALAAQLETGNKEVAERMQKEEEQRKREADELKVNISKCDIHWFSCNSVVNIFFK